VARRALRKRYFIHSASRRKRQEKQASCLGRPSYAGSIHAFSTGYPPPDERSCAVALLPQAKAQQRSKKRARVVVFWDARVARVRRSAVSTFRVLIKCRYDAAMRGAANLTSAMEVAADLRRRILRGELKPGARLKIDDVAALCDVSHMPVRVALQSLEAEGVLDVYPHRGAVIKSVDARFVRNMLELRAAIEVMLTEKCARLLTKDGLEELEGLALDFESAAQRNDSLAIVTANLRFHDAISRTADNAEALRVLARGRLLIQALRVRYGFGPGRVDQVIAEHRALVNAIARKDERRAGDIARRHCEGARDELLALL
jgi:DNA-binding GntR family transcriptional regulator